MRGKLPAALANQVSDAIRAAIERGMEVDEAACVVVAVAADYARDGYGIAYLSDLAAVVKSRNERPGR